MLSQIGLQLSILPSFVNQEESLKSRQEITATLLFLTGDVLHSDGQTRFLLALEGASWGVSLNFGMAFPQGSLKLQSILRRLGNAGL